MSADDEARLSSAGDRVVAIAGFLAILLTGFFGDEPDVAPRPVAAATTAQSETR